MVAAPLLTDEIQADAFSVVKHPDPMRGNTLRFNAVSRGPLLPAKGTREREWRLRQYDHHDYNSMFRAVRGGIVKRIQSTPWEVSARDADRWQRMLMNADHGDWDRFVSKVVTDYLRHDSGAWVELIAPGDPRFAPTGPIVGLGVLDTLRVYPTRNPTYPAIYYDIHGKMHLLHRSRVHHLLDSEDSEEDLFGYGESALTRCIASVHREILLNRYVEQYLDDKPMPGIMLIKNAGTDQMQAAIRRMQQDNNTDMGGDWGKVIQLFSLDPAEEMDIKFVTNSKAPEGFDYSEYINMIAKQEAAGIGVDIQDFWELAAQGIGTGSQSQIIAQKSRGKTIGNLLKRFERMINRALPEHAEFKWQYRDAQEDAELAQKATDVMSVVQLGVASGTISQEEGRIILASQVEMFKDALLDADGNIKRLNDDDPKSAEQIAEDTDSINPVQQLVEAASTPPTPNPIEALIDGQKSLDASANEFIRRFTNFVRVGQANNFSTAIMRANFRDELFRAGEMAYEDGLRDGGADPLESDAVTQANRRRRVAEWFAVQDTFIGNLVEDIAKKQISPDQIPIRASMWVNKSLRAIYYIGMKDAAAEKKYMWVLGATKEHCDTCLSLAGQVHEMWEWMSSGWMPGCTCLECKGYQCDCRLVEVKGQARGRLPNPSVFSAITDRFVGLFRRSAKEITYPPHPDVLGRLMQRMAA